MTDQPRDFPLAILTDFAPVPREQNRRDGWGPEVQRAFIARPAHPHPQGPAVVSHPPAAGGRGAARCASNLC